MNSTLQSLFSNRLSFKLTAVFVSLAFSFVAVFGIMPAKKSKAFLGIADVTFTQQTVDIPKLIGDILVEVAETAFAAAKKAALNWLTKRITNAILGVEDTSQGFIQDWTKEIFGAADNVLGEIVNDLFGANLCDLPSYFDKNFLSTSLKTTFGIKVPGVPASGALSDPRTAHPTCKLSTIVKNVDDIWNSALASAGKLGHDAWKNWSILLEPTGNEFGVYLTTVVEGYGIQQEARQEAATKAIAYQGFKGKADPESGDILVPGITGKDAVNEALMTPMRSIITADDIKELAAAVFTASLVRLINEGLAAADVQVKVRPEQVAGSVGAAVDAGADALGIE